jgi:hypothetical protein
MRTLFKKPNPRHLISYFMLLLLIIMSAPLALCQQTISRTNEKVITESAKQTVSDYAKYMELLAQEVDKDLIALYKAELLKSVQRDSVNVFNDLIPIADRPKTLRENIDRLTTYLDDISSRYFEGVKLVYTNFVTSKVFIDEKRNRLFVKVTADRSIDGTYTYKDEKKPNKATEKIDFYVQAEIKSSGVPESKIYSIFLNENNEQMFKQIKVVEKTAPIVVSNVRKDSTYRRAMEHTLAWNGGEIFERLRLDIYKDVAGKPVLVRSVDSSFVNDNKIKFEIDKKVKPGKRNRYYFQLTKLSSEEQPIKSENFYIRRKMPLILQVGVPLIVVGGVTYLLLNPKEEAKDPQLPDVPDPG